VILPLSEGYQYKNQYAQAAIKQGQAEEKAKVKDTSTAGIPLTDLLTKLSEGVIKPLKSRLATLEHLKEQRENIRDANVNIFVPKGDQTINTLAALIDLIESDIAQGKPLLGFGRFLNYAIENMEDTNEFLSRDDIFLKESTAGVLLNYERFLNSYEAISVSINSLNDSLPGEQRNLLNKFAKAHSISKEKYAIAREKYIKGILSTSSQPLTAEEIDELYSKGNDIDAAGAAVSDLDTSSDIFLRIIARNFKEKMDFARIKTMDFIDKLDRASADLINNSPGKVVNYDFMYEEQGENNYRIINPIGNAYFEKRNALYEALKNKDGVNKRYREVPNLKEASQEDVEYNKELYKAKKELADFNKPEIINEDGTISDGQYHKYTEEFKAARAKYEYFNGIKWTPRAGISRSEYYNYRSKYYQFVEYIGAKVGKDGKYTGVAVRKTGYFPKGKYKEIRQDVKLDGKDIRSEKYIKLMEDNSDLGKARRKFYAFYKNEYDKGFLQRLPTEMYNSLKFKFPTEDAVTSKIDDLPTGVLRTFGKMGKAFVKFATDRTLKTPEVRNVTITEDGEVVSDIPVMYTSEYGGARNVEKLEELEETLKNLRDDFSKGKLSIQEFNKEKDKIRVQRNRLNSRPKNLKPVRDFAKSMKSMAAAIEMYEKKLALEDEFYLLRNQVNRRQYFKGEQQVSGNSNTMKRLENWMKQIYRAEDSTVNFTRVQRIGTVIARKMKSALSLKSVGLNPISWTTNAAWGVLTDAIEAAGGRYYNIRSYSSSVKEYNLEYLPGIMRKMSRLNSRLELTDTLPNSKYEAVVRRFDMVRNLLDQGDRGGSSGIPFEYKGIDVVEYAVQSQSGIAILKTLKVKKFDKDGNEIEEKSLYDAIKWNPENHSVELPSDYKLVKNYGDREMQLVDINDKEVSDIRNYIFEVNKQMHGNYAEEDKVVLQQYVVGDLMFQFHKWIVPGVKAHFRSRYFDENLGWYEGRVISFMNFMRAGITYSGNFKKAWENADDLTKRNLRKGLAQWGTFMGMFLMGRLLLEMSDGDDEDDIEATQTVNAILVMLDVLEGDAAYFVNPKEYITGAKNPVPVLKYATALGEAGWRSVQYLYYAIAQSDEELLNNKSVYYQRGYRKGKKKLAKEWRDVLPILSVFNRWEGFKTVRTNYFE
jgi:hypothetical protein